VERAGLFDSVLVRETDGDGFETSLCRILDEATRARLRWHPSSPWLHAGLTASAERLAARIGVPPSVHMTRPALDDAVRWVVSHVSFRGAEFSWTFRVRCPLDVALEMARRDEGGRPDEVS